MILAINMTIQIIQKENAAGSVNHLLLTNWMQVRVEMEEGVVFLFIVDFWPIITHRWQFEWRFERRWRRELLLFNQSIIHLWFIVNQLLMIWLKVRAEMEEGAAAAEMEEETELIEERRQQGGEHLWDKNYTGQTRTVLRNKTLIEERRRQGGEHLWDKR